MLIIATVCNFKIAKRDISYGDFKKVIWQLRFFITLNGNGGSLIKLLGNASTDLIQFNSIACGIGHGLRQHTQKISCATGRFQYISGLKSQLFQCLIHGMNDHRRGIEGGESGFSGSLIFLLGKQCFQLRVVSMCLLKSVCQTTPAYILG